MEQIGRKYTPEERLELLKEAMGDKPFSIAVEELVPFGGGLSEYYDMYKIPYYTKNLFESPKLENYQSHTTIKAPLSN